MVRRSPARGGAADVGAAFDSAAIPGHAARALGELIHDVVAGTHRVNEAFKALKALERAAPAHYVWAQPRFAKRCVGEPGLRLHKLLQLAPTALVEARCFGTLAAATPPPCKAKQSARKPIYLTLRFAVNAGFASAGTC